MALQPVGVIAVVQGFGPFIAKMGAMNKAVLGVGTSSVSAATGMGTASKALTAVGVAAAASVAAVAALAVAIAKIGIEAVETAISVESAFAGILKTTNDLGTNLFDLTDSGEEVFQNFRDLAKEIPLSFEELAKIGELGGQLNVAEDDLDDFTKTIASLAVATNLTEEEASLGLARLATVFGAETDEISDIVEQLGSAIVFLGNNFAATEQEILLTSRNLASAGAIAGFTEADVLGLGTALKASGIQAEAGGTAVRNAILDMNSAVATGAGTIDKEWQGVLRTIVKQTDTEFGELADIFNAGGEELENFADRTGFSVDTITQAITKGIGTAGSDELIKFAETAGLTSEQFIDVWETNPAAAFAMFVDGVSAAGKNAQSILDEVGITSTRAENTFLALAGNSELLTDAIIQSNEAFADNTALAREADIRFSTLESQLEIAKNRFRDIGLTIGLALAPGLQTLLENLDFTPIVNFVENDVVPAIEGLVGLLQDLFAGEISFEDLIQTPEFDTAGIVSAFQPLIDAFGIVAESARGFAAVFSEDIPFIKQQLQGLVDFAKTQLGQAFPEIVDGFSEGLLSISGTIDTLTEFWEEHGETVIGVLSQIARTGISLVVGAVTLMSTAFQVTFKIIEGIVTLASQIIEGNWVGALETIRDTNTEIFGILLEGITGFVDRILQSFGTDLQGAIEFVTTFVESVRTKVGELAVDAATPLANFIDRVIKFFQELPSKIGEIWESVKTTVTNKITEIRDSAVEKFNEIRTSIIESITGFVTSISEKWEELRTTTVEKFEAIRQSIVEKVNEFLEAIGVTEEIKERWRVIWEDVQLIAKTIIIQIAETITRLFTTLKDTLETVWEGIKNAFTTAWNAIVSAVMPVVTALVGFFVESFETLKGVFSEVWEDIKEALITVWETISEAAGEAWGTIKETITEILDELKEVFGPVWEDITDAATTAWEAIRDAISGLWDEITELATTFSTGLEETITKIFTKLQDLGANIIEGIVEGITGASQILIDSVTSVAEAAIAAAKKALGIESPSKVFMDVGFNVMKGFEKGLLESAELPINTLATVSAASIPASDSVLPSGISGLLNGGTTSNRTVNVNANYYKVQSPQQVVDDLALVGALGV